MQSSLLYDEFIGIINDALGANIVLMRIASFEPSPYGRGQGEGAKGQFNTPLINGMGIRVDFKELADEYGVKG
jgi:hypothetical protein